MLNIKIYTIENISDLKRIALQEYINGWWGIVVTEHLFDEIKLNSENDIELNKLFSINVIINNDFVTFNNGHCVFVDKEVAQQLLDIHAMRYELYKEYVNNITS